MRILVIGATGTIGAAVVHALEGHHDVIAASHARSGLTVDLGDPDSIKRLYASAGPLDAVVCTAGASVFRPLAELSDADFTLCLGNKLMGQVNLVRFGTEAVADGGSFTLTTGILSRQPMPGSAAISAANAGLEGFVRAAALELPRGIRVNAVAPGWVRETLVAMKMDPALGMAVADVARTYVQSVEGKATGQILDTVPSRVAAYFRRRVRMSRRVASAKRTIGPLCAHVRRDTGPIAQGKLPRESPIAFRGELFAQMHDEVAEVFTRADCSRRYVVASKDE